MRRSLALLLILFILLGSFFVYVQVQINLPREDVVIEHELLEGDSAAAEGITLSASYESGNHLYWDTVITLGSEPSYDTEYDWAAKSREYVTSEPEPAFYLYENSGYGISGHVDLENDIWLPYLDIVKQVAARTQPGKERVEFLNLKDYTEFLDLGATIDFIDDIYYLVDGKPRHVYSDSYDDTISDFFRIPVPEEYILKILVSKRDDGEIYRIDMSSDYNFYIDSSCVRTEEGLYFTLSSSGSEGIDPSFIPGGFGIFHLPISWNEEHGLYIAELDKIANVYSFGRDIGPSKLFAVGDNLALTWQEDGFSHLTVFDRKTMEPLQTMKLSEKTIEPESAYIHTAKVEEDYVLLWSWNDEVHVLSRSGDLLTLEFTASLGDMIPNGTQAADAYMIYDGERLAVTSCDSWRSNPELAERYYDSTSLLVAVYTKDGLEYYARFRHSFDELAKTSFASAPYPASRDALKLEFAK